MRVRSKKKALMTYEKLYELLVEKFGHSEFISTELVNILKPNHLDQEPDVLTSFANSSLNWCVGKGLVARRGRSPIRWKVLPVVEKPPEEASSYGIYIVDIGDYEVLLKSVQKYEHMIKELVSSEAHAGRVKTLAGVLGVPYRVLPSSYVASHRQGRWFLPPRT